MTAYLFIGGPWDGRWISAPALTVLRVPEPPDFRTARFVESDVYAYEPPRERLYYRQRALVPGWRFPLTFYTTEPLRNIPAGTVLPGSVQGMRPDASETARRIPIDRWAWAENIALLHDAIRWHECSKDWGRKP